MPVVKNSSPITHHPSQIPYFPGCGLKDQARGFELAALAAMERLGYELAELPRWNCCGTVYSLASDDLMRHLAPIRNLIRVQELGESRLVTLCSMCFGTLKRSAQFVEEDPERLATINAFMDEEDDYRGGVEVLHLLAVLRDEVGYEAIEEAVERPLEGLKVAPYYGCMLLRPRGLGVDDPDHPRVMEELLSALGAEVVDHPYKVECCGSYLTAGRADVVEVRVAAIAGAAVQRGADLIATSCPLCQFNLDTRLSQAAGRRGTPSIPSVYFTQLLALALGADPHLGEQAIDPRPVLAARGFLSEVRG